MNTSSFPDRFRPFGDQPHRKSIDQKKELPSRLLPSNCKLLSLIQKNPAFQYCTCMAVIRNSAFLYTAFSKLSIPFGSKYSVFAGTDHLFCRYKFRLASLPVGLILALALVEAAYLVIVFLDLSLHRPCGDCYLSVIKTLCRQLALH